MDAKLHDSCRYSAASSTCLLALFSFFSSFLLFPSGREVKKSENLCWRPFLSSQLQPHHSPHYPKNRVGPLKRPFLHLPLGVEPRISSLSFLLSLLHSPTGGCLPICFRSTKGNICWLQIYTAPLNITLKIKIIK